MSRFTTDRTARRGAARGTVPGTDLAHMAGIAHVAAADHAATYNAAADRAATYNAAADHAATYNAATYNAATHSAATHSAATARTEARAANCAVARANDRVRIPK